MATFTLGCLCNACSPTSVTSEAINSTPTEDKTPKVDTPTPKLVLSTPTIPEVIILMTELDFPEGPAFDPEGNLWCTEMGAGNLVCWNEGQVEKIPTHGRPNGLAFDRLGRAWICDSSQNAIRRYDIQKREWETLIEEIEGETLQTPNDLAFDLSGNLLFTCPNFTTLDSLGYIACYAQDGTISKIAEGMVRPNGIDLVNYGKLLVAADTVAHTLYRGEWDSNQRILRNFKAWVPVGGTEGPDGMIPSTNGDLYCAIFGDGIIKVIDEAGNTTHVLPLPGLNPTNVALDPSGKLGLVVTEAEKGYLLSLPAVKAQPAIFDGGLLLNSTT
jgi:gluconolactonase